MRCAVLGRGKSLALWNAIPARPLFDLIYLVNDCSEESRRIGLTAEDGTIEHVFGRKNATVLTRETYERLNVKTAWVNALGVDNIRNMKRMLQSIPQQTKVHTRPPCMYDRGYLPIGWKKLLRGVTSAARRSDNGNAWPTTGLYAIELMLAKNGPSEVWLFGFDFYRDKYLIKANRPHQNQGAAKVQMMYRHLQKLVDEFAETQFYSATDLGMEGENWHAIR